MAQTAIKGVFRDGKIIPQEEIPYKDSMNVIIVFLDKIEPGEERYYKADWIKAEKKATQALIEGNVKTAASIDEMFEQIEVTSDAN
jgi:hypothetical protein